MQSIRAFVIRKEECLWTLPEMEVSASRRDKTGVGELCGWCYASSLRVAIGKVNPWDPPQARLQLDEEELSDMFVSLCGPGLCLFIRDLGFRTHILSWLAHVRQQSWSPANQICHVQSEPWAQGRINPQFLKLPSLTGWKSHAGQQSRTTETVEMGLDEQWGQAQLLVSSYPNWSQNKKKRRLRETKTVKRRCCQKDRKEKAVNMKKNIKFRSITKIQSLKSREFIKIKY